MLEKVDLNKSVDKENYKKLREEMDVKLGELQRACKDSGQAVRERRSTA